MTREEFNWRSFANQGGLTKQWNSPGTPAYYVLDPEGTIRHKWTGNPGARSLELILETLIREAEEAEASK